MVTTMENCGAAGRELAVLWNGESDAHGNMAQFLVLCVDPFAPFPFLFRKNFAHASTHTRFGLKFMLSDGSPMLCAEHVLRVVMTADPLIYLPMENTH